MARNYSSAGDRVTTGLTTHSNLRSIFLRFWPTTPANALRLFDKHTSGTEASFVGYILTTTIRYQRDVVSGTNGQWDIAAPSTGAWATYCLVRDETINNNQPTIYLNGSVATQTAHTQPVGTLVTNTDPYVLGNRGAGDRTWVGKIADFAVWDALLTADEVASLEFVSPLLVRPTSLVCYVPQNGRMSPEPDWFTAGGATVTGTTYTDGPAIGSNRSTYLLVPGAAAVAPVNTVAPAISGSALLGQTLTTDNGTWTGTATINYTYQWQRDDSGGGSFSDISSATSSSYLLVSADVGCAIRCVVTGTNGGGTASANSNSTGLVSTLTASATDSSVPVTTAIFFATNTF